MNTKKGCEWSHREDFGLSCLSARHCSRFWRCRSEGAGRSCVHDTACIPGGATEGGRMTDKKFGQIMIDDEEKFKTERG